MNPTFCIGTSTPGALLQVVDPVSGMLPLVDDLGNAFYATSTCPSVSSSVDVNFPPYVSMFFDSFLIAVGVVMWFVAFEFVYRVATRFLR